MKYFGDRFFSSWLNRGDPEPNLEDEMVLRLEKIRDKATRFNEKYEEEEVSFVVEEVEMTQDFKNVLPEEAELEPDPWDVVTMHGGRL